MSAFRINLFAFAMLVSFSLHMIQSSKIDFRHGLRFSGCSLYQFTIWFSRSFLLNYDQKKIDGYFLEQIYGQLSKKFDKWQRARQKELRKLILSCRERSSKVWHHLLMQEIRNRSELQAAPYILDIEQVCSAFFSLPDRHGNARRSIRALLNISVRDDIYKNNDTGKVAEILETLKGYSDNPPDPAHL